MSMLEISLVEDFTVIIAPWTQLDRISNALISFCNVFDSSFPFEVEFVTLFVSLSFPPLKSALNSATVASRASPTAFFPTWVSTRPELEVFVPTLVFSEPRRKKGGNYEIWCCFHIYSVIELFILTKFSFLQKSTNTDSSIVSCMPWRFRNYGTAWPRNCWPCFSCKPCRV